jgi:hypothetical protein
MISLLMKHPLRFFLRAAALAGLLFTAGCNSKTEKKDFETVIARFLIEADEGDAFATVTLPVSGVQIAVNNRPAVTEFDFTGVQLAKGDLGQFLVFTLTPDATRDVYRVTATNQGKRLVLFINGTAVGARMIDRPFNTGTITVYPAIPDQDLPELVKNMDATSADMQKKLAKAKQ